MRKLASIRKIVEIKSIPDADSICAYRVDNWWVVDLIGQYEVGDLVVYAEPDSWVPTQLAPFLSKGKEPREYDGIKGECLRTVRLRGQLSQGLLLPITVLDSCSIFVGADVTEALGIVKYEPPVSAQLAGLTRGTLPREFPKTDEERIQNLTDVWEIYRHHQYEITEKLEGCSMSVGLIGDDDFVVCSRNLSLKETSDNTLWKMARKLDIEHKLKERGVTNTIIQGELIGEGIQKNHYRIRGHAFYVFSVYDILNQRYYTPPERIAFTQSMGLAHVPVIEECGSADMSVDAMLQRADGMSVINPSQLREGLVYKRVGLTDDQTHFKTVSNLYLLKKKE